MFGLANLILSLGLSAAPGDTLKAVPADSLREVPVNVGLAPGLNANGSTPEQVRNRFALNLAMNDAGAIDGVDIALGVARTRREMRGLQLSLGANLVEGNLVGAQFSSVNIVQGSGKGFQAAHGVNYVRGDFSGLQAAMVNVAVGKFDGVQSGTVNVAGPVRGLQVSLVNIGGNVSGAQVGLVNIASVVHGAQIGLVNISDTLHGAGIGLVNVARNIRLQGDAWVTESGLSNVGLVSGTEHFYMMAGATFDSPERAEVMGWNVGLGGRFGGESGYGSLDLVSTTLVHDADLKREDGGRTRRHRELDWDANNLLTTRLSVGWRLLSRLEVYGGVSGNVLVSEDAVNEAKYVTPPRAYHWDATSTVRMWPGAFLGIRI